MRDFFVPGEVIVKCKFGSHVSGPPFNASGNPSNFSELGLCVDGIRITPNFNHQDINIDDFGPNVPPEVLWQLADFNIRTRLIHFDNLILTGVVAESMAGNAMNSGLEGVLTGAGTPMGAWNLPLASGNHYISLNIIPASGQKWRFPTSYLTGPPFVRSLGTAAEIVDLNWRAIPYSIPQFIPISGANTYPLSVQGGIGSWYVHTSYAATSCYCSQSITPQPNDIYVFGPYATQTDCLAICSGTGNNLSGVYEIMSSGALLYDHGQDV